jgi:cytochrome P450
VTATEAPLYDPFSAAIQADPFPVYRVLRDEHPVYFNPDRGLWVLSRFADVEAALRDPATYSSANGISLGSNTQSMVPLLLTMDPPRHDQLRKLVSRAFTPRRVADLEPRVRELASSLLDRMVTDCFDAIDFAAAFPTMVIADLLGVPTNDHERFRAWVESVITIDPGAIASNADAPSLTELFTYLQGVIDERERQRRDDMISALLDADVDGERLGKGELLGFVLLLLAAGFETTKNLIGNGIAILGERPELRRRLVATPDDIPKVIEEVLRYESPVACLTRMTTRDVELHSVTIPEGARVLILYASANRDDRAFERPDDFDPDRTEDRHLAFGQGIHYCLGAALARLEARVAFEEVLARLPEYEVTGRDRFRSPYIQGYAYLTLATL